MWTYRDMTFCRHWRDCAMADHCTRPLTNAVIIAAEHFWGGPGVPIATFSEQPECHVTHEQLRSLCKSKDGAQ